MNIVINKPATQPQLPAGTYLSTITAIRVVPPANGKGEQIEVTLHISHGGVTYRVRDWLYTSGKRIYAFAVAVTGATGDQLNLDIEQTVGKTVAVQTGIVPSKSDPSKTFVSVLAYHAIPRA